MFVPVYVCMTVYMTVYILLFRSVLLILREANSNRRKRGRRLMLICQQLTENCRWPSEQRKAGWKDITDKVDCRLRNLH